MGDDGVKIPDSYVGEVARFFEAHVRWRFGHACVRTSRDRELAASRELAADLVQDTFEAAALAWETLRELTEAQQRAWLRTTLSRREISHSAAVWRSAANSLTCIAGTRPQNLIPSSRRYLRSRSKGQRRSSRACQVTRRELR